MLAYQGVFTAAGLRIFSFPHKGGDHSLGVDVAKWYRIIPNHAVVNTSRNPAGHGFESRSKPFAEAKNIGWVGGHRLGIIDNKYDAENVDLLFSGKFPARRPVR